MARTIAYGCSTRMDEVDNAMKKLVPVCFLVVLGAISAHAQTAKALDPAMTELMKVKWISNHDPGFGGGNEFYKLSKQFVKSHTAADFRRMVNHFNPIVRAMGLLCLAQTEKDASLQILMSHSRDEAEVYLHEGCLMSKITVGDFAKRLLIEPDFLDP